MKITKSIIIDHPNVPMVDEDPDNGLKLYCYTRTTTDDDRSLYPYRGIVFEEDNEEAYMIGVPYCIEFHDEEDYSSTVKDCKNYDIYDSHEGTIIRVFFYKNKWYTSTHRKLDAFNSKWASPRTSFGKSFAHHMRSIIPNDEIDDDKEYLTNVYESYFDHDHQYIFLLKSSEEERIVCDAVEDNAILHIGTIVDGTLDFNATFINLPKPRKHVDIETLGQLDSALFCIHSNELQGLLLINKQTGEHIKIYTKNYLDMSNLRNNVPSVRFRYIQLLTEHKNMDMKKMRKLYSNVDFKKIHHDLKQACIYVFNRYIDRHIQKKSFKVDPTCHYVLCKAREAYLIDRRPITPYKIETIITQNPTLTNKMIKYYKKISHQTTIPAYDQPHLASTQTTSQQ
jgi:hypothetical protein